jgi:hypothetical protein
MSEKLKLTIKQQVPSRIVLKPALYTYDDYTAKVVEVYEPKSEIVQVPKTQLEQEFNACTDDIADSGTGTVFGNNLWKDGSYDTTPP